MNSSKALITIVSVAVVIGASVVFLSMVESDVKSSYEKTKAQTDDQIKSQFCSQQQAPFEACMSWVTIVEKFDGSKYATWPEQMPGQDFKHVREPTEIKTDENCAYYADLWDHASTQYPILKERNLHEEMNERNHLQKDMRDSKSYLLLNCGYSEEFFE